MSKQSLTRQSFMVAVAATSMLAAGYAFAADQNANGGAPQTPGAMSSQKMSAQDQTAAKDAGKLSTDGAQGYQDVALARLAIFDGRTADAKKFADAADAAFGKAKTDRTVFVKAEDALMSANGQGNGQSNGQANAPDAAKQGASNTAPSQQANATPANQQANNDASGGTQNADTKTPKAWLPVDGEISVNEDFSTNPTKAAAVADANKSLAKGDRQGAIAKLKVAQIDLDYTVAVVPLQQTLTDVHQAATLVDDGQFYQASQQLRKVQDSTRYDLVDMIGTPDGAANKAPANGQPMKGAAQPNANK